MLIPMIYLVGAVPSSFLGNQDRVSAIRPTILRLASDPSPPSSEIEGQARDGTLAGIMANIELPETYEQTCLQYDGSREHYCNGKALAFCAQLNATVSIDACTAEVGRGLQAEKEAEQRAEATPAAIAARRAFSLTPQGRMWKSKQEFYANRVIAQCVMRHQMETQVLERCNVQPRAGYAMAAMDFVAKIRPGEARGPGMTIGGRSAWVSPWINAHCNALAVGYRCYWRGISSSHE